MLCPHQTKLRATLLALVAATFIPLYASAQSTTARAQAKDSKAVAEEEDFERGKQLLSQGDEAGAAALLQRVAEARKNDADAWYLLGVALSRAGKTRDARKSFEKSLALRPPDADSRAALSYTLLQLGKPQDAEREARGALAFNPQVAEAHYVVGVVLYRNGKFKEAEAEAESALRVKPTLGAAAYLAGDALMAIYFDEADRQAQLYPFRPEMGDEERKTVVAKRDAALESIRTRMREIASNLETIINAQPNNPEAELWREQAGSMRFYGGAEGESSGVFRSSEVLVRATILAMPEPGFTEEARRNNTTGAIRLRAVLAADGHVRNIAVIRSLPDGLTEMAIAAARKIVFKPAFKDGHAVSQYVTLEYHFGIR